MSKKLAEVNRRFLVIGQFLFFSRVLFGRTEIAPKSHGRVKRQYKSGDARNDVRVLLIF
jgi:hypothetical protein